MNKSLFLCLFVFFSYNAMAGFRPGLTRVVYDESKNEASIPVAAVGDDTYYLVQAWVDDHNHKRADFIVTPPIFKLSPETQNNIRMRYIGSDLEKDRESMFWLNIKAIPSKDASIGSQITIASKSVMKLIYRPSSLNYKDAIKAKESLSFSISGNNLIIKNPTPYYINFGRFFINSIEVKDIGYAEPFGEFRKTVGAVPNHIKYSVIDDFGGVSEPINRKL